MIQMRIQKEAELYNPLDPSDSQISEKVYYYLKSFLTEEESEKQRLDKIQIITAEPVNEAKLKTAIQNAAGKEQKVFDRQLTYNKKIALWELIIGILLSVLGVALSLILDQILLAIISFFGSTTISDAIMIFAKQNPEIKRLKKLLNPLCDFELEVVNQ